MTRLVRRTARSARRKPLLALLCVLAVVGGGSGAAVTFAATAPSAPPPPVLTGYPSNPNGTPTSTFAWTDSQPGVTFLCSVENGKFFPTVTPPGGGSPQPCQSPLTYSVSVANNGMHQFAVEAVDADGNISTPTKYQWKVPKSALPLTISGNAGPVYPGGPASAFQTTITNPNTGPVTVNSLTVGLGPMPSGCDAGWFTLTQSNVSLAQPITVPGSGSVTLPNSDDAPGVSPPSVSMSDTGDQSGCETQTIPVVYDNSYAANFTVGGSSQFTVTLGSPSGGLLYPTPQGSPPVDTVQVTVANPSPGAQYVHSITYEVTPDWTETLDGSTPCTASDFSIDGENPGRSDTVSVNQDIPAGGQITRSFTIQLVDNGQNQDACRNAQVGLTALVN